ncbi:hypothetical protein GCM10009624_30980 [Gordonia sinesedis]
MHGRWRERATEAGHRILANWLEVCGIEVPPALVDELEREMADAIG